MLAKAKVEADGSYPNDNGASAESEALRVTAVIPAFNEELTIEYMVRKTLKYAGNVIVVDDGSEDGTARLAHLAGASVIRLPVNTGKGNALSVGLKTAVLSEGNLIVCLDADGQHDPDDIPRVCAPIIDGDADFVIGSRFLEDNGDVETPAYRTFGQKVLTVATNLANRTRISDSQSGFRCLTKEAVLSMSFREKRMGIESDMIHDAARLGLKIREVPISCRYIGLDTSTHRPISHGMMVISSILRVVRDEHPLLFFGVSGLIFILCALAFSIYSLITYTDSGTWPLLPSVVASLLFVLGAMCILCGLILNSLTQRLSVHDSRM